MKAFLLLLITFAGTVNAEPLKKHGPIPDDIRSTYVISFKDKQLAKNKTIEIEGRINKKAGRLFQGATAALSMDLSTSEVDLLSQDSDIKAIEKVMLFELYTQTTPNGVKRINTEASSVAAIDGVDQRVDADVAVIDTGADLDHPDLNIFKYAYCYQTIPAGTCSENDNRAEDAIGHGTHVAGIIGALDNTIGVVGVAPGARLWIVDVSRTDNAITTLEVLSALEYVYAHSTEIDVVNMSLGFLGTSTVVDDAIAALVGAGVTVVVAAGNDAIDVQSVTPASNPNVLTVSAFADFDGVAGRLSGLGYNYSSCSELEDDSLACFSNYGSGVDFSAPGTKINSTYLNGGYAEMHGTSMASPHVAGAAALYLASNPASSPALVKAYLQSIADDTPCGSSGTVCSDDPDAYHEPLLIAASTIAATPYTVNVPTMPQWAMAILGVALILTARRAAIKL